MEVRIKDLDQQEPAVSAERLKATQLTLGNTIRREREKKVTRSHLANSIGVSKTHLYQIERGENRPSARGLGNLEEVLELDEGSLFAMAGREPPAAKKPSTPAHIVAPVIATPEDPSAADSAERTIRVSEGFATDAFAKRIHNTKKTIDIMTGWIGEDLHRLQFAFLESLGRGVVIHIILTHPDQSLNIPDQYAMGLTISQGNLTMLSHWYQRWRDEWDTKIPEERRERGWSLFKSWNQVQKNLAIRILPISPSIQYFRFDSDAMVGFFLQIEHSRQGPQLEIRLFRKVAGRAQQEYAFGARTLLGRMCTDEFEDIWGRLEDERFHYNLTRDLSQLGELDDLYQLFREEQEIM